MKNKTKILQIIFVIMCILLLCSVTYLGYIILTPQDDTEEVIKLPNEGNLTKPEETTDLNSIKIDLVDYTLFKFDDLDFKFIIAKIRVKSNDDKINVDLSHFKTNENITLDDVSTYVSKLETKGYFLGKQNVWFELVSTQSSYIANIFIPIKDVNASKIQLNVDFEEDTIIDFDLNKITGTKEMLTYVADDVITDGKTYQMKVSKAYDITGEPLTITYSDGVVKEYLYPSTAEVYAFQIDVVSVWGDELELEDATYSTENDYFDALSSQISTDKYLNLINQKITDKSTGILMFMTLNPKAEPITYKGTLKLKFKGQDNFILIDVDL